MRSDKLGRVSVDLLAVTPLVNRLIRRKLLMTTLSDTADLKLLHFEIMHVLKDEGTMHPAKIGEKLLIAKAQMTHLIDKLVDLDFVKRELDSVDRRTFNITLTEQGKEVLSEQDNLVFCAVSDIMASLPETELETLSDALRSIRDILFKLQ